MPARSTLLSSIAAISLLAATGTTSELTVRSLPLNPKAPLSRTMRAEESDVLSKLGFEGQYFDCRRGPFGVRNMFSLHCAEHEGHFGTPTVTVLKNGKKHALYENVFDGGVSPDGKYISLQNATKSANGTVTEHVRIIDIQSKTAKRLPLVRCTENIMRWSRGALITASDSYGSVSDASIDICAWSAAGKLIGQFSTRNFATGTTDRPINRIGFLPSEKNALYVLAQQQPWQENGACVVNAMDIDDPSRFTSVTFDPDAPANYACASGLDDIELDLTSFTIAKPSFRFRVRHDVNSHGDGQADPWTTVPVR